MEKGSVTLKNGQNFDLENYCSRKWLKTNKDLNRFIKSGKLSVVFDSENKIPSHPVKSPFKTEPNSKPKAPKHEEPIIVDFSEVSDPDEIDAVISGEKEYDAVNKPEKAPEEEPEKESEEEPKYEVVNEEKKDDSNISEEELNDLSWSDIRSLAKEKGINSFGKSREDLVEEILNL